MPTPNNALDNSPTVRFSSTNQTRTIVGAAVPESRRSNAAGQAKNAPPVNASNPETKAATPPTEAVTDCSKVCNINSKDEFEKIVGEAGPNKLVIVEFFAQWCGPCKMIGTKLEELAQTYEGRAIIMKIDVDDLEDIAIEYNVTSMPTLLIMRNKRKIDQVVGSDSEKIESNIARHIAQLTSSATPTAPVAAAVVPPPVTPVKLPAPKN